MTQTSVSQTVRAQPINEILYIALNWFGTFAKEADVSISGVFQKIVFHAITNFEITQSDISMSFGLSRGTISKWMNGKATPHPMVRRLVVDWIAEQVLSKAAALDGVREALKTPGGQPSPQIVAA
jgi:hypothetical protein